MLTNRGHVKQLFGFLVALVILALIIYQRIGSFDKIAEQRALTQLDATLAQSLKQSNLNKTDLLKLIDQLGTELSHSPMAQARLGELCLQVGWFEKGIGFFEAAIAKDPSNVHYQTQSIYAMVLLHQGKMPDRILAQALKLSAAHPEIRVIKNLLAMHYYLSGEYQSAVDYWEDVLIEDPDLTGDRQTIIENAIAKSKNQLLIEGRG